MNGAPSIVCYLILIGVWSVLIDLLITVTQLILVICGHAIVTSDVNNNVMVIS